VPPKDRNRGHSRVRDVVKRNDLKIDGLRWTTFVVRNTIIIRDTILQSLAPGGWSFWVEFWVDFGSITGLRIWQCIPLTAMQHSKYIVKKFDASLDRVVSCFAPPMVAAHL
jgi:hypothetical protein